MASALEVFSGVHPEWKEALRSPEVKAALLPPLNEVVKTLREGGRVAPEPGFVLEALRFCSPDAVTVVVIGQDPYPGSEGGENVAQGLSFSCELLPRVGKTVPKSLVNIGRAVAKDAGLEALPRPLGDLRFWAAQGVLLLNRALTTIPGKTRGQFNVWLPFSLELVKWLVARRAASTESPVRPLVFLLWGKEAGKLEPAVAAAAAGSPEIQCLRWSHPSPLSDNQRAPEEKFENCGHFREVNRLLRESGSRPIRWVEEPSIAACDGSCKANGSRQAKAGYGAMFVRGPLQGMEIFGSVLPFEYCWVDEGNPLRGFRPSEVPAVPTNNRGEYLGICKLLLAAARAGLAAPLEVVTDSQLVKRTLEEWLPARRRKGTADQLKNYDLVLIADRLLKACRCHVTITHVRSHRPPPVAGAPTREKLLWAANDRADRLAAEGEKIGRETVSSPFWLP